MGVERFGFTGLLSCFVIAILVCRFAAVGGGFVMFCFGWWWVAGWSLFGCFWRCCLVLRWFGFSVVLRLELLVLDCCFCCLECVGSIGL